MEAQKIRVDEEEAFKVNVYGDEDGANLFEMYGINGQIRVCLLTGVASGAYAVRTYFCNGSLFMVLGLENSLVRLEGFLIKKEESFVIHFSRFVAYVFLGGIETSNVQEIY